MIKHGICRKERLIAARSVIHIKLTKFTIVCPTVKYMFIKDYRIASFIAIVSFNISVLYMTRNQSSIFRRENFIPSFRNNLLCQQQLADSGYGGFRAPV